MSIFPPSNTSLSRQIIHEHQMLGTGEGFLELYDRLQYLLDTGKKSGIRYSLISALIIYCAPSQSSAFFYALCTGIVSLFFFERRRQNLDRRLEEVRTNHFAMLRHIRSMNLPSRRNFEHHVISLPLAPEPICQAHIFPRLDGRSVLQLLSVSRVHHKMVRSYLEKMGYEPVKKTIESHPYIIVTKTHKKLRQIKQAIEAPI